MGYYQAMNTQNESRTAFVVRRLRSAMPSAWQRIADESKVPYKTIYKIAYRSTKDPRESTIEKLYSYFMTIKE